MSYRLLLFLGFLFISSFARSQYSSVGRGGFSSTLYGPLYTDTVANSYSRYAFTYPASSLGDIHNNDSIRALSFLHKTRPILLGNTNVKIYLKNGSQADFGSGSLNWNAAIRNNAVLVYDGSLSDVLVAREGKLVFVFNQNLPFAYSTAMPHLQVFVQYTQSQAQAFPVDWYYESSFYVPQFVSNNESKSIRGSGNLDSICTASTILKPTIGLYYPRFSQDLSIVKIHTLGSVAQVMTAPDTTFVLVSNVGKNTIASQSLTFTISGANSYTHTAVATELEPFSESWVSFASYAPLHEGQELITISTTDSGWSNNSRNKSRTVDYSNASYIHPSDGITGDYTFTPTSADFATKFYCAASRTLEQFSTAFNSVNVPYKVMVWQATNGSPGAKIYESETYYTQASAVQHDLPSLSVSGAFFIGIRQLSSTPLAIAYQTQKTLPVNSFFISQPAQSNNWSNLQSNDGYVFDYTIKLGAPQDLSITQIITPGNKDTFIYNLIDSITIGTMIHNIGAIGYSNEAVYFSIKDRNGTPVLQDTQYISVSPDSSSIVYFKKMSLNNLGPFTFSVHISPNGDAVQVNNRLERNIVLVSNLDFAITTIFQPSQSDSFEVNRTGFIPVIRVINLGRLTQTNVPIVAQLVKDGQVILEVQRFISLGYNQSMLVVFDSMTPTEYQGVSIRFIAKLESDFFRSNDTLSQSLIVKNANDAAVLFTIEPRAEAKYEITDKFFPQVAIYNLGKNAQSQIWAHTIIQDASGNIVYADSSSNSYAGFQSKVAVHREFVISSLGDYSMCSYTKLVNDQYNKNDTLCVNFYVTEQFNLKLNKMVKPESDYLYIPNPNVFYPSIELNNVGLDSIKNAKVELIIWDQNNTSIYQDTLETSLAIGQVKVDSFTKGLLLDKIGAYSLQARNIWPLESTLSKSDTLTISFQVRPVFDLALTTLLDVLEVDTLELNGLINARLNVENAGIQNIKNIELGVSVSDITAKVLFTDTLYYENLKMSNAITLQSSQFYKPLQTGPYFLTVVNLIKDSVTANDTLQARIDVVKRIDGGVQEITNPILAQVWANNQFYKPQALFYNDGLNDIRFAFATCEIWYDTMVYISQRAVEIPAGGSESVTFDSLLLPVWSDSVQSIFYLSTQGDRYAENDTLTTFFKVLRKEGITNYVASKIAVYPNPFNGHLHIESELNIDKMELYSAMGKLVTQTHLAGNVNTIDVNCNPGQYFLWLYTDSGIIVKKLVKIE